MLVISRKPNERIVFPTLGIALQIVRVQNNVVRVAIEAPPEVKVLRAELAEQATADRCTPPPAGLTHAHRNRLNKAMLSLHMLQRHLEMNNTAGAQSTLNRTLEALDQLAASCAGV